MELGVIIMAKLNFYGFSRTTVQLEDRQAR